MFQVRPKRGSVILPAILAITIAGCGRGGDAGGPPGNRDTVVREFGADRDAAVTADPSGASISQIAYLNQGWSPADSERFYFTSQGSQVVPYSWFLALEQADSTAPFRDNQNLHRFGYLTQKPGVMNPDGLPVGFVKDDGESRAWLGFSCAACHTAQIDHNGIGYRIDGGPALADVQGFLRALTASLKATRNDEAKFSRFASSVLRKGASAADQHVLRDDLTKIIERREGYNARNFPDSIPAGFGRVDALGAILNEVFHHAANPGNPPSELTNTQQANAPVSYPFLWDTPQHEAVQYIGVAKNAGLGSLGRNVGEVLGVFGDLKLDAPHLSGYQSSVRVQNLRQLETWLTTLWSPQWPNGFPKIDVAKAKAGRDLFVRNCAECHKDIDRMSPQRQVKLILRPTGTDRLTADNFWGRKGATGNLQGAFEKVLPWPILQPATLGASAKGETMLDHAVIGAILGSWKDAPKDQLTSIDYSRKSGAFAAPTAVDLGVPYKARPLNGIWATAPYLHNGSVPNLYQLLQPVEKRSPTFSVGSRLFDPVNVGFRTDAPGVFTFRARDAEGKPIPGNSNAGHLYGANLKDEERWQLVEYLKTL